MASSSEEVLEAAVARIPEIARIIASLTVEDRPSAFDVAERSYLRTAKYLGGADDLAQGGPRQSCIDCVSKWKNGYWQREHC